MTENELITKMTTTLSLSININAAQKALLSSAGATQAAAAKRGLAILEKTELRSFFLETYPSVKLSDAELNTAIEVIDIKKEMLSYKDFIKFAVSDLRPYIPVETVRVLEDYYRPEDPIYFIAVTTAVVAIAALQQAGDLK